MALLSYLTHSTSRIRLLGLLWGEETVASVKQLAEQAGIGYASAHVELTAMNKEGLVTFHQKGKAVVCRKNNEYPNAALLKALLKAEGMSAAPSACQKKLTLEETKLHLVRFGAPLGVSGSCKSDLSLEAVLVAGLELARKDASVARVLPLVFEKNAKQLNRPRLKFLAREKGLKKTLGFFFDLSAVLSGSTSYKKDADSLFDNRLKVTEDFFATPKKGRYRRLLAEQNTPSLAKKWHFSMNMGMGSFEDLFNKNVADKR
ncbi:MAG: hypothetical protein GY868_00755 [Deltaproteobacteria bacterium]|nr:hypothetical protein [Deltaproteobacteria bacterium]